MWSPHLKPLLFHNQSLKETKAVGNKTHLWIFIRHVDSVTFYVFSCLLLPLSLFKNASEVSEQSAFRTVFMASNC